MNKYLADFQPLISGILILLLTIFALSDLAAQPDKLKVYVWDFTTRDRMRDDLTRNFTVEFEEALIQTQYYDVLLRREYDMLFSQKANEKGIMRIEGIPKSQLDTLKTLQADAVVFGVIYDDIKGVVIRITISIQDFNSKIIAQRSTLLRRGLKDDPVSRQTEMSKLVGRFLPKNKIMPSGLTPKTKQKATIRSLAFPGWGQYYAEQNNKAISYAVIETAALVGTLLFNYKHGQAIDDFNIAQENYATAVSQADLDQYFQQMETKHDDIKNAETIRNLCIGAAIGMWVWNVLDTALFGPKTQKTVQFEGKENNRIQLLTKCVDGNEFIGLCLKF